MWEKEKFLVVSNFSLFRIVFKRLVLQTCKTKGLFGKGLYINQNIKFVFYIAEKIMAKGENVVYEYLFFFPMFLTLSQTKPCFYVSAVQFF